MSSEIIDWNAPSLQRTLPALPKDLPHGLIVPPQEGWDEIAASDEKLLREHGFTLNEEARVRELNRHTLNYYFEFLKWGQIPGRSLLETLLLRLRTLPVQEPRLFRWVPA